MSHTKSILFAVISSLSIALSLAHADDKNGIEVEMVVQEKVVTTNDKGEKTVQLVKPSSVIPGDTVVYTTFVQNNGKKSADNIAITNPIPAEIDYINNSATGNNTLITFSVDGGKTFGNPEELTINENDKERPATHKDYTHILWTLKKINPEEKAQVSFHGKLK